MYWIAVLPELQGLGIPSLILEEVASKMIRDGIKWAETGPQLVDNLPVKSLWDHFEYEIVRRRRCYQRKIREEVSLDASWNEKSDYVLSIYGFSGLYGHFRPVWTNQWF